MSNEYSHCGLRLRCNRPLPALARSPAAGGPDLDIWIADGVRAPGPAVSSHDSTLWYESDDPGVHPPRLRVFRSTSLSGFRFEYAEGLIFEVDAGGARVRAWRESDASEEALVQYLLGVVTAFAIRLRGQPVLHASAVRVGDGCVAFAGDSGGGKSTVATAFGARGHPVLCDDVCVVDDTVPAPRVQPAGPTVRLWPDVVEALLDRASGLPADGSTGVKQRIDFGRAGFRFCATPLPLSVVYLLDWETPAPRTPCIERLSPRESLMGLLAHSFPRVLLDVAMRAAELERFAAMAERVPVRRLRCVEELESLEALCAVVVQDVDDGVRPASRFVG